MSEGIIVVDKHHGIMSISMNGSWYAMRKKNVSWNLFADISIHSILISSTLPDVKLLF